jgi:hypothetical protein
MRRVLRRALAVVSIVALSSSWAVGWSAALHVAADHHDHDGHQVADTDHHADRESERGLQLVLHGHGHADGTPSHRHPVTSGAAAPPTGNLLLSAAAVCGDVPVLPAGACSSCRMPALGGPTHDPPTLSGPVLRI